MKEIWKGIKEYKNYQVSNVGRVKNIKTNKLLTPKKTHNGYLRVGLSNNGVVKQFFIHRLVYEAFYGKIPFWLEINHIDENPINNQLNNLMLCNHKRNINWGNHNKKLSVAMTNRKDQSKPVLQYELDGTFVKEYPSVKEIERQKGYANSNISSCCRGFFKQAYGFIWKYKI